MNLRYTDLLYLSENFTDKFEGFIRSVSLLHKKPNGTAMPLEDEEGTLVGCNWNFSSNLSNLYYLKVSVTAVIDFTKTDVEIQTY